MGLTLPMGKSVGFFDGFPKKESAKKANTLHCLESLLNILDSEFFWPTILCL